MGLLEGQGRRRSAREGRHQDDAPPGAGKNRRHCGCSCRTLVRSANLTAKVMNSVLMC